MTHEETLKIFSIMKANYFKPQLFRKGDFKMAKKVAKVVKMELPGRRSKNPHGVLLAAVNSQKIIQKFFR